MQELIYSVHCIVSLDKLRAILFTESMKILERRVKVTRIRLVLQ